jgi:hypothetical protein
MSKNLLGLGDNDIDEMNHKRRAELRQRNPDNDPEVTLEMWTLAHLTRDDRVVKSLVYGVVTQCLTDDYMIGDIACSPSLLGTPDHPGRRIYVTQKLRYECKGAGNEVTISEAEFDERLLDPYANIDDSKRRLEGDKP